MEYSERKPNRLCEYDYSQNGAYFITICTQDRKKILSSIIGGDAHDAPIVTLTKVGEIARKYILSGNRIPGVTVDKFVIMPDHIHMIVFIGEKGTSGVPAPVNAVVPHFVSAFKRLCHREIGEPIFQRSYYDHVIRNQMDYDEILPYIENNPRKWVIKERGYE